MTLPDFTKTLAEAENALAVEGFTSAGPSANIGPLWRKASRVDDFAGGYIKTALVEICEQRIAPEYGGGNYYYLRFL